MSLSSIYLLVIEQDSLIPKDKKRKRDEESMSKKDKKKRLANDTDKASKDRLSRLDAELSLLKEKQAQLNEQWEHEKSVMTRIQSIKEEVQRVISYYCGIYSMIDFDAYMVACIIVSFCC